MNRGFSFVEIVIGVAVLSLSLFSLLGVYNRYFAASRQVAPTIQASYLLEEGIEVIKIFRDTSWASRIATLSTTTTYYLSFSTTTSAWSATTTASLIDTLFARTVAITDVKRDSTTRDIVSGTGVYDPNSKLVTVTVQWLTGSGTTTQTMATYLTNIFGN